ncbi:MAG: hypothetical protein GC192_07175 [Bacteroidetes bacterium]|nr:hypothetical protein [Bacteroidota bacterium]
MFPTPDGGYIAAGHTGTGPDLHDVFMVKYDPFGHEQWRQTYGGPQHDIIDDFKQTSDGGYLLCGTSFTTGGNGLDFWLTKTDRLGIVIWSKTYGTAAIEFARAVVETSDGGYALVGRSDDGIDVGILLVKTDSDGNEVWSNVYGGSGEDEAWGIAETIDNQLVITGQSTSFGAGGQDVYLAKIALDGSFQWFQTFGGPDDDFAFDVLPLATGGFMVSGTTRSFGAGDYDVYLLKISDNGTLDWQKTYGGALGEWGTYIAGLPDGGFALAGSTQSFNNLQDDLYLVRTDADGNLLWQHSYGQAQKDIPHSLELAPDGGFLIAAHSRDDDINGNVLTSQGYLLRLDAQGGLLTNYLQGHIFFDENNDCLPSPGEAGFGGWYLTATKTASGGNTTYYGITDADGHYSILTDSGSFLLRLVSPNGYWQPCSNDLPLVFTDLYDTLTHDFPLQVGIACPQLEVDIATTALTPCATAFYEVKYCNNGTATASAAELAVTLDSALAFVASQIPSSGQSGLTWFFDLGDVPVGDCGSFFIETFLDCDAGLGRTHLVTATVTPDAICLPPDPNWDGSNLMVQAVCEADSVRFTVENTGVGGMSTPQYSIIVEDQIIGRALEIQLGPGEFKEVTHPVEGKTLRMEVPQTPGHPGESRPSVSIEACGNSTGFVTMFPQDDADVFRSIHARENLLSPLANMAISFPKGIDNQHFIKQNTDIEYLILFQNTGEDTASTVVIEDTLSHWLDLTTLRQGAASHPYSMSVSNGGVLQFTLENLGLPPATVNDSASIGYVKFRVSQVPDAPWDSLIVNSSGISFDFGQPVAKPQYFHRIQKPQILSISDVSLCTGGLYGGVAYQSDTTFFETTALPWADSLNFVTIDVGEFGATVVFDTFTYLNTPINGWLLMHDTTIVENFDLGANCDSIVVWNVDVLPSGVEEPGAGQVRVWPNPFSEKLFLEASQPILSIEVRDCLGRSIPVFSEIEKNHFGNQRYCISTIGFQAGIYLIFARTPTGTLAPVKLVKH